MSEVPSARSATAPELAHWLRDLTRQMLRFSGEGAEGLDRTVRRVARAYDGRPEVSLTAEGATVTVETDRGAPCTVAVSAFPDVARLDRAEALKELVEGVVAGELDLVRASAELRAIESRPAPYPRWARLLGIVLFSVGFAPAVQATWYEVGTTAVLATVVGTLTVLADRHRRLAQVLPILAAITVSLLTLWLFAPDLHRGGPVMIMLPALFFFVPGDLLSAAAVEIAAGYISSGSARLVYAFVLLLQLYVGILLGVSLTNTSRSTLLDTTQDTDMSHWAIVAGWAVFTTGLVLAFSVPLRSAGWVTVLVYLTLGVQAGGTALVGEVAGTFAASVALAVGADLLARSRHRPPRLLLFLGGFFTLTVGSMGLRALTSLAGGHVLHGFHDLMDFVTIVTTISVGLLVGATLLPARPTE